MKDKLLTVAITTYNRKKQLLETLRSFERLGQYDQYKILISNNCSNYNVNEWLSQNLTKDFFDIIIIYNRQYNVGADINISFTFQLCDTKWMWLMSDDDIVTQDSLSIVLSDIINVSDNVAHIKYSIVGFDTLPDMSYNSFEDVLKVFDAKYGFGQFVFMSNNVINLESLNKYIGIAPYYANTCITQLIPSIYGIKKEYLEWKMSKDSIVNYNMNNSSYSILYAIVNFSNISFIDVEFTDLEIHLIQKLFRKFDIKKVCRELIAINPSIKRNLLFYKIWKYFYSIYSFKGLLFFAYFNFLTLKLQVLKILFEKK